MTNATLRIYETLADFAPDWVAIPGETISDLLEERGWSQAELAARTGFSDKHVNLLLKGKASITEETALKLERVLGSTANFWLNLEAQYREHLARNEAIHMLSKQVEWLKELPLNDMIKFKWVNKCADKAYQVFECLRYFGVASVDAWREQYIRPVAAYRAAEKLTRIPASVSAWLRVGERAAEDIRCADYDKAKFEAALSEVRLLTTEKNPAIFLPKLTSVCAKAGVVVVFAPAPKGCPVSGATKWLGQKALIMLSLRGKTDDKLWFTFFHEAGHIIKHGRRMIFLDILGEDGLNAEEEEEADTYARDSLISKRDYDNFVKDGQFTKNSIKTFSRQQGVSPGIVLGRLQFDRYVQWNSLLSRDLKVSYTWNHESES